MQVCVVALPWFLCVKEGIWNDYADAGRRVFKVLECGHVVMERVTFAPNKNQAFKRLRGSCPRLLKGCRSKASPTRLPAS